MWGETLSMSFPFRRPRNSYLAPALFLPSRGTGGNRGFLLFLPAPFPAGYSRPSHTGSLTVLMLSPQRGARSALAQVSSIRSDYVELEPRPHPRSEPPGLLFTSRLWL